VKRYLTAAEVVELADLLENLTLRTELVDRVLDAAKQHRGMTLILTEHVDQTICRTSDR
jgi:hypothetical protein